VTAENPTTALARVVQPLEHRRAAAVREAFSSMFDKVEEWQAEAAGLVVTAEDQTGKMERAGSLRREIKKARTSLENRRKELKAGVLIEGRAIDGAFAIFEGLAAPMESFLLEQEKFAERAEAGRKDALRDARTAALFALGVKREALPATLGDMSEETWSLVLADAQAAQRARDERAREDERERAAKEAQAKLDAAKSEAEWKAQAEKQKAENERLKREQAARDKEAAEARAKTEAEHKAQRQKDEMARVAAEAQAKADRDARAESEKRADDLIGELRKKAPQVSIAIKTKYAFLVETLRKIVQVEGEPKSAALATGALVSVDEAVALEDDDPLGLDK
jgi:colicin import membrane protein